MANSVDGFEYDLKSDYFEIDELIALPVQILNRKGYITACCCAGHPFDLSHEFPKIVGMPPPLIIGLPCQCYITFDEIYSFPELPPGFILEPTTNGIRIWKEIYKSGVFNYDDWKTVRDIFESVEQLYEWALKLPNFNAPK